MTTTTLKGHKYAQAHINYYNSGNVELISYTTEILKVNNEGWLYYNPIHYTKTTIKHIGWFMKELYGLSYQHVKWVKENNLLFNVLTGEVIRRV